MLTGFDRQLRPEEDRDAATAAIRKAVPLSDRAALTNGQTGERGE